MAASVNIHEAKTNFSKLVRRAEEGEEIIVRRGSEPVAQIGPLKKPRGVRGFGSLKGKIRMPSDEELRQADKEIEQRFEESVVFPEEKPRPDEA